MLHSIFDEQGDSPQKKSKNKHQEKNPIRIELINNKYIDSSNQTRPESDLNPFSTLHNFF